MILKTQHPMLVRIWNNGNPHSCLVEMQEGTYSPFGKQFDGFLQSLTHSSHESAIVILGVYANELKIVST